MKKLDDFNTEKYLRAVKEGDSIAFEQIYYRYLKKIKGYAYRFTRCNEEAEELVQDTFVRLWENRAKLDPAKNFDAYLFTLIRNNFLGTLRKKAREQAYNIENLNQEVCLNLVEEELNAKESKQLAQCAIETFSPQVKKIYHLSRNDHRTHEEISELMGISKNTVNNHLKKSLGIMRKYFSLYSPETLLSITITLFYKNFLL